MTLEIAAGLRQQISTLLADVDKLQARYAPRQTWPLDAGSPKNQADLAPTSAAFGQRANMRGRSGEHKEISGVGKGQNSRPPRRHGLPDRVLENFSDRQEGIDQRRESRGRRCRGRRGDGEPKNDVERRTTPVTSSSRKASTSQPARVREFLNRTQTPFRTTPVWVGEPWYWSKIERACEYQKVVKDYPTATRSPTPC